MRIDKQKRETIENAVSAMAKFKKVFDRDLTPSFVAELYACDKLGLEICDARNEPGFDTIDNEGKHYQIKYRSPETLNVDINNFNFDYVVLVNVDDKFLLSGMWLATIDQAKEIFTSREKFRKNQVTQKKFKSVAKLIR